MCVCVCVCGMRIKIYIYIYIYIYNYMDTRRDEVTGKWRRLHNEELNEFTAHTILCGCKIEKNEMGWACGAYS